jgi:hypothetical protein
MNYPISFTLKITDLLIPQVESTKSEMLPTRLCHCFGRKKAGLFAHRINDSLSVGEGSLNVGDNRINDRIYDLAPAPINRINGRVADSYHMIKAIHCFCRICY